jgi:sugar phosphate isomerase/epimerase
MMEEGSMKLLFFRSLWGMVETGLEDRLKRIKTGGFDGVEMNAPDEPAQRQALRALLDALGLELIVQQHTTGQTPAEHLASFEALYRRALDLHPRFINSHTGKDYYTTAENAAILRRAVEMESELGVPVTHEIHRGRATFSAPATEALIEAVPAVRFTADFSHWCVVHESLLEDQAERVAQAVAHSAHIHARVGFSEGPQVNDPRAPEWQAAVDAHLAWWQAIADCHAADGREALTITPEFGPPGYMPTLPFTRQPVSDLWEVNVYMRDLLRSRLRI